MVKKAVLRPAIAFMVAMLLLAVPTAQGAERGEKGGVTFNFVDVELAAVAKFVSEVTGKNFIFDERVRGKITIIAPSPLSAKDAFNLFSSVLDVKGLALVPSGVDAYKIVPAAEVRQAGVAMSRDGFPANENYIARLIPLKHISSDDALRFLQPVVSRTGHISSFGPGNLLLVVDTGLNMEKVLNIVEGIDQPPLAEEPEVVQLKYAGAEDVAAVLNEGLKRQPGQAPAAADARAVPDKRLNAVVLFGPRGARDSMRRLIEKLDVAGEETRSMINVYFLEYADAEEMADVMSKLMTSEQKAAPKAQQLVSARELSITPDKATNALVIVASPADYASMERIIKQLDRRRRQVFVEAMIVEASIDRLKELGSKWRAAAKHKGQPIAIGGVGVMDSTALQQILFGLTGFSVGGVGTSMSVPVTQPDGTTTTLTVPGFAALFSLSEFENAIDVLSTPQILTSDNSEAEIHVGQNVPFVSSRERDVTTTNTVLSSIERQDVGITLRITPQITEGDAVRLDIYQEISSVQDTSTEVFINVGPTTTKRSTKTSVLVQDEQTVVISGLMEDRVENSVTRVPLLHRIPLLGWLFKFKSARKEKTNLLVFLTPHIIKSSENLSSLTQQKQHDFAASEDMYVEGELLVKFKEGVTDEEALSAIEGQNATLIEHLPERGIYRVRLQPKQKVPEAAESFSSLPEVEYAEPNFILSIQGGEPLKRKGIR